MSTQTPLETLIAEINDLNTEQQQVVLSFVRYIKAPSLSQSDWFLQVDAFHATLRANHGDDFRVDVQNLLDEIREERLNGLMGSC